MSCKIICIMALIFFGCCLTNARVFYVDDPSMSHRRNYHQPIYPIKETSEQASRDLDLNFSAGDSIQFLDNERNSIPTRQPFDVYIAPERPIEESREYRPHYSMVEVPTRRIIYGERYPVSEKYQKLSEVNNEQYKGNVVLELRVITNNRDSIAA